MSNNNCETGIGKDYDHQYAVKSEIETDPNGIDQHQPGAKLDAGKPMAGVLEDFSLALMAVAEIGTFGVNKYSRGSWQSVPNGIERYTDAAWRHLLKEPTELLDDDSGLMHAAHMAWNILARLELMLRNQKRQRLTDNNYEKKKQSGIINCNKTT